jgi:hypothetical protein
MDHANREGLVFIGAVLLIVCVNFCGMSAYDYATRRAKEVACSITFLDGGNRHEYVGMGEVYE